MSEFKAVAYLSHGRDKYAALAHLAVKANDGQNATIEATVLFYGQEKILHSELGYRVTTKVVPATSSAAEFRQHMKTFIHQCAADFLGYRREELDNHQFQITRL